MNTIKITLIAVCLLCPMISIANDNLNDLIVNEKVLNAKCTDNNVSKGDKEDFCKKRDLVVIKLKKIGWCRDGSQWGKCTGRNFDFARIMPLTGGGKRYVTGDVVTGDRIIKRFYFSKKCDLPIYGANHMNFYSYGYVGFVIVEGCWKLTTEDSAIVIYKDGNIENVEYFQSYPSAIINDDKSATILEKNYDSDVFLDNYMVKKSKEAVDSFLNGRY